MTPVSTTLNLAVTLTTQDDPAGGSSCGCDSSAGLRWPAEILLGIDGPAQTGRVDLATDSPESVAFGDLASGANVVLLQVTNRGKVRARLTSADGTQQAVPVDGLLVLVTQSVPITAIDLMRVSGSGDSPRVFFALAAKL